MPCSEEVTKKTDEYWIPRIGDKYDEIRDYIMCADAKQLKLQGDSTFQNASSIVKISIEPCYSNPLINNEDCEFTDEILLDYWSKAGHYLVPLGEQVYLADWD